MPQRSFHPAQPRQRNASPSLIIHGYELQAGAERLASGKWKPVLVVRHLKTRAEQRYAFDASAWSGREACATSVAKSVGIALVTTRDPELSV